MRHTVLCAIILFLFSWAPRVFSEENLKPEALSYTVLYTGQNDTTHFKDETLPWQPVDDSDPAVAQATPFQDAKNLGFVRIAAGMTADWHPAPRKQFIMILRGVMEVEAGDGEKRTFSPGSVLLVTDTDGRGHRTSVLGSEEVFLVWVPVP